MAVITEKGGGGGEWGTRQKEVPLSLFDFRVKQIL